MPSPRTRPQPALGKSSPPRLGQSVARERLFAEIDNHATAPGLWVAGPRMSAATSASVLPAKLPPFFTASVLPDGHQFDALTDEPLLISAELGGIAWPSSCRNGTCRTCIGRLERGTVRYEIEWPGLSAEEKQDGYILPCVAHPCSDVVLRAGSF